MTIRGKSRAGCDHPIAGRPDGQPRPADQPHSQPARPPASGSSGRNGRPQCHHPSRDGPSGSRLGPSGPDPQVLRPGGVRSRSPNSGHSSPASPDHHATERPDRCTLETRHHRTVTRAERISRVKRHAMQITVRDRGNGAPRADRRIFAADTRAAERSTCAQKFQICIPAVPDTRGPARKADITSSHTFTESSRPVSSRPVRQV
jgi:hypothetical protein